MHGFAAVVVEATILQVDMVHGKGDDAESGASRGRCQTATRQDETDENSIDDANFAGSVASADVPSEGVQCSDGAVVSSVASADVPSDGVECSNGAVAGSVVSADVPSEGVECSDGGQQPPDRVVPSS